MFPSSDMRTDLLHFHQYFHRQLLDTKQKKINHFLLARKYLCLDYRGNPPVMSGLTLAITLDCQYKFTKVEEMEYFRFSIFQPTLTASCLRLLDVET